MKKTGFTGAYVFFCESVFCVSEDPMAPTADIPLVEGEYEKPAPITRLIEIFFRIVIDRQHGNFMRVNQLKSNNNAKLLAGA